MSETRKGVVTTAASAEEAPNATVACSSPPCFMHELDPSYLGYLGREEVSALLGGLLAADWGDAVPDEGRLRAALCRRLGALGDRPNRGPSGSRGAAVSGKPAGAAEPPSSRLGRSARAIREALPRIYDDALRRDLQDIIGAMERGSGPHLAGTPSEG